MSLIEREAAIDVLDTNAELLKRVLDDTDVVGVERAKYEWGLDLIESYITDMKELPPAQLDRKKGKWIQNNNGTYSCSLCHSWIPEEQYYYAQFCLYCGADMRGETIGKVD